MKKLNLIDNIRRVPMSDIRKTYFIRLIGRIAILLLCVILRFLCPGEFEILKGMNFFHKFSVLHLLWALWMLDMLYQIIPVKKKIALGSQKLFRHRFKPIRDRINSVDLKKYIVSTTKSAYKVMLIWIALGVCIGLLYFADICKCYYQNVEKFRHENVGIYAFLMVVFFFYNDVIFLWRYPVCEVTSKKLSHS